MKKISKKAVFIVIVALLFGTACGKENTTENNSVEEKNSVSLSAQEKEQDTKNEEKETKEQEKQEKEEQEMGNQENGADFTKEQTPFAQHGKLSVKGTNLCDSNGEPYQLKGVSTLGIVWFPQFVNEDAFATVESWGGNLIRIAVYTQEYDGYLSGGDQEYQKQLIDTGVRAATDLGMYVIIDWHILSDGNPNTNKEAAKVFFQEMTQKYAGYDNVLYEICNEPNGNVSWEEVKSYAEEVIPVIRANAPESIIIVGTPTWSQDVDIAAQNPLQGENIMYACHFYAASHKQELRDKVKHALDDGIPVFISEYSICDASGNGAIDYEEAEKWAQFIDENNLSYVQWNLANKEESSSLIRPECQKVSGWEDSDLTETGLWLKKRLGK